MFKKIIDKIDDRISEINWANVITVLVLIITASILSYYFATIKLENDQQKELIERYQNNVSVEDVFKETRKYVMVHIKGEVKNPGVYELEPGIRVSEAIETAGGFTDKADQESVNLAEKIKDEMEIDVASIKNKATSGTSKTSSKSVSKTSANSSTSTSANTSVQININTASAGEFISLGLDASLAENIVAYRQYKGSFGSTGELLRVNGMNENILNSILSRITV